METAGNPPGQGHLNIPTGDSTRALGPSVSGANSAVACVFSRVSHVTSQEHQMPRPLVGMHFPLRVRLWVFSSCLQRNEVCW